MTRLVSTDPGKPGKIFSSVLLATAAAADGHTETVYFIDEAVKTLQNPQEITQGSFSPLRGILEQANLLGVRFYACEESSGLFAVAPSAVPGFVEVVGAARLNDLLVECDASVSL